MLSDSAWNSLYRLFAASGINDAPEISWVHEVDGETVVVPLAWPTLKIAFVFEWQTAGVLRHDGWEPFVITPAQLAAFNDVCSTIDSAGTTWTVKHSAHTARNNVSETENVLLAAILTAGIPAPDRTYRIRNDAGRIITTPDFSWPDEQVALFVHGIWWHGGKEFDGIIKQAADDPDVKRVVVRSQTGTLADDATKRRELAAQGWLTLEVTDQELAHRGPEPTLNSLRRALAQRGTASVQDSPILN